MIKIFFVMTIMALPQMIVFASYSELEDYWPKTIFKSLTFASLGQATTNCSKSPFIPYDYTIPLLFTCGKDYTISEVYSAGITVWTEQADNHDIVKVCYLTD